MVIVCGRHGCGRHGRTRTLTPVEEMMQTSGGAVEYNVGMLSAMPEGPTLEARAGRGSFGGAASPSPPTKGVRSLGERCKLPEAPENFEFRALWDLKIASKQCNVAKKLYERI